MPFCTTCSVLNPHIIQGMLYIHGSLLESHGNLRSSACLIDSRWMLKITSFGLGPLKSGDKKYGDIGEYAKFKRMLWTAPELLRNKKPPPYGTPKGDVYSFGIIIQEIVYRSMPFFLDRDPKGKQFSRFL